MGFVREPAGRGRQVRPLRLDGHLGVGRAVDPTSATGNVGVSPRKSRLAAIVASSPSSGLLTWSGRRLSYSSEINQRPAFGILSSCSAGDPSDGVSEGLQPSGSAITGGMFQTIAVPLPFAIARPSGVSQSRTAPGAVPSSRVRRLPVLPVLS